MHRRSSFETAEESVIRLPQHLAPSYDVALRRRVKFLAIALIGAFCLLLGRTWYLQVYQGDYFFRLAENNRLRSLRTGSLRGKILSRQGEVLADNRPSYTLMAIPELLPDPLPAPLLTLLQEHKEDVKADTLLPRQGAAGFKPIPMQRDLSRDQVAYFAEHRMDFPGLFIEVEPLRVYPEGTLAAHLLGYLGEISESQLRRLKELGYAPGDLIGQYGLEQAFEDMMRGEHGLRRVEVNALGRETRLIEKYPPTSGNTLVLTINLPLQRLTEQLLEGHTGSIVALDPRNGQILAMASRPTFDPNMFATRPSLAEWKALLKNPRFPLHNRAAQGQYPPGSVFKIVTAIAALAEGVVTPQTTVCCPGHYVYGGRTFRDWRLSGHGCVQLRQALAQSCDVYFYHVGQMLGIDRIAQYARAFGLGQVTGFAPGLEKSGIVPSTQWKRQARRQAWYAGETLSVAIGQGYTLTTPLQVVNMFATLANGGTLYRPYVVLRRIQADGTILPDTSPTVLERLGLPRSEIAAVQQGLWSVVNDPKGTGKAARHEHIAIAGKTGTAQVVGIPSNNTSPQRQAHLPEQYRHHAWFGAYAPFDDPRIAVVVMIENAGKGGGQFAGYAKTLIAAYLTSQSSLMANSQSDNQVPVISLP